MGSDQNWLGGYCWDMAIALHETTKLPLYGLFDEDGTCHHAYVWDDRFERGIDGRGMLSLDGLIGGGRRGKCAGTIPKPLEREAIEGPGGWLGRPIHEEEVKVAVRFIKKMKLLAEWKALDAVEKKDCTKKRNAVP